MINPCFSHTDSTVHVKPQNNDRIQFIFTIKNKLIHKVQKSRQIIWFSFTVSVFLQNILGSGSVRVGGDLSNLFWFLQEYNENKIKQNIKTSIHTYIQCQNSDVIPIRHEDLPL